jgi:hypothetical protein
MLRAAFVLALILPACGPSADSTTTPPAEPAAAKGPTVQPSVLLRPPDGPMITPFGRAQDALPADVATLLHPELLANAAPAEDLLRLLPKTLLGVARGEVFAGVQEGTDTSWVGAIAVYDGGEGAVSLLIRDTGWDPVFLNLLAAQPASEVLKDGRTVARISPLDRPGQHAQTGVGGAGRIILQAHDARSNPGRVLAALEEVDPKPIAALEASTGLGRGAWPASPKQPDPEALTALASPEALLAALPEGAEGWVFANQGHGYRRDAARQVLAEASRTWSVGAGVIRASITDLGAEDAPVTMDEKAWSVDDAGGLREDLAEGGAPRCSEEFAACKWASLQGGRYVLSLTGPASVGVDGLAAVAKTFGTVAP